MKSRKQPSAAAQKFSASACFSASRNTPSVTAGSPWTDLLRVDVLNILGLSMMLMGVLCWLAPRAAALQRLRASANRCGLAKRGIFTGLLRRTL